MTTIRLSSEGQLVLPKSVRDAHGWAGGEELILEDLGDAVVIRAAASRPIPKLEALRTRLRAGRRVTADDVVGVLHRNGPAVSIEDMDSGIATAVTDRDARSRY